MGLSHLVATGDEAPWPDCRSSRRHSLGLRDARRSDRCRPSRASQKTAPEQQKRHPGHLPAEPGFLVSRV